MPTNSNDINLVIDRKLPIALIIMVLFQTAGLVWSAASISFHVERNGKDIIETHHDVVELEVAIDTKQGIEGYRRDIDKLYLEIKGLDVRLRDLESRD